jgi:hypothetical protein
MDREAASCVVTAQGKGKQHEGAFLDELLTTGPSGLAKAHARPLQTGGVMKPDEFRARRSRTFVAAFEAVACALDGSKIRGTAFRRSGPRQTGDDYCYRFYEREPDECGACGERSRIRGVVAELLSDYDLWLLEAHVCAGVNFRVIATACGCDPGTACRRLRRILRLLRVHPAVKALEPGTCACRDAGSSCQCRGNRTERNGTVD